MIYTCIEGTQANSQYDLDMIDMDDMDGDMDGEHVADSQMSITNAPDGEGGTGRRLEVNMLDSRPKKLTGQELIKENVKELYEVIAYMDYSFERAFTIQEKEFMLAYKVSIHPPKYFQIRRL